MVTQMHDDDTVQLTPEEQRAHLEKILKTNQHSQANNESGNVSNEETDDYLDSLVSQK